MTWVSITKPITWRQPSPNTRQSSMFQLFSVCNLSWSNYTV